MTSFQEQLSLEENHPTWLTKDERGKPVCNFIPSIVKVTKCANSAKAEDIVHVKLVFNNGDSTEVAVKLTELDRAQWSALDPRCIINVHYRHANKHIGNIIRAKISNAPVEEKIYLDRIGIHHINGKTIFLVGNHVITPSSEEISDSDFVFGDISFCLDIDETLSLRATFEGMCELISICSIGKPLIAYTISGIIRAAFIEAGVKPTEILYVFG